MVSDALLTLQAKQTVTATTNGTALIFKKALELRPSWSRWIYSAAQQASGSGVWTFVIQWDECTSGANWFTLATADPIVLTASAQQGEIYLPFQLTRGDIIQPGNASIPVPQIRASAILSGSPTTPTITYGVEMVPGTAMGA